jgi:transcription termination/antitermination protein NusA
MNTEEVDQVIDLFARHVPEIASGVVEIKAAARIRGYRTKLAVLSHDPKVDPVGVCVGLRGYRIKNVVDQLGGERMDIVRWVDSPEQFIPNALQPAQIHAVLLDHPRHRATVVVSEDQVSLAHGRGGMNRELASRLCAWEIVIEGREGLPVRRCDDDISITVIREAEGE